VRAVPVGEHAVLLEVAGSDAAAGRLDPVDAAAAVRAAYQEVLRRRAAGTPALAGTADVVPGATTVLVDGVADPAALIAEAGGWRMPAAGGPPAGPVVEIEVFYDGPDLEPVAAAWGVAVDAVPGLHAGPEYTVAFLGFAPGFGYLAGLPVELRVPRRATPRSRVPAGAVGVADVWTGVYPTESPGGWQLLGRTDAVLWEPGRNPPALLAPGTRVRFRAGR
jgi:KipI family sensor histidine kinase inhibitor